MQDRRECCQDIEIKEKYGLNNNAYRYADVDMLNEKIDGLLAKWYNDN